MNQVHIRALAAFTLLTCSACEDASPGDDVSPNPGHNEEELLVTSVPTGDSHCPHGGTLFTASTGEASYACNGAPGTQGQEGGVGGQGPVGADGQSVTSLPLEPGASSCPRGGSEFVSISGTSYACNGNPGAAGESVVVTPMLPGNGPCIHGGTEFTSATTTSYACNAPGAVPSIQLDSLRVVVDFGDGEPALFAEIEGLGSVHDVVEQTVVGSQGATRVLKLPGRLRWNAVTLRRGVTHDIRLWHWRAQVEKGQISEARRDVQVTVLDGRGTEIRKVQLTASWPSKLTVPAAPGPYAAHALDELVLVTDGVTRTPGFAATPSPPPPGMRYEMELSSEPGVRLAFVTASGLGSETEVVEQLVVDSRGIAIVRKVPGRLRTTDVALRCNVDCGDILHAWRDLVVMGEAMNAQQPATIFLVDSDGSQLAQWELSAAWPSQLRLTPAPAGGTFEELTIVHEGALRAQ